MIIRKDKLVALTLRRPLVEKNFDGSLKYAKTRIVVQLTSHCNEFNASYRLVGVVWGDLAFGAPPAQSGGFSTQLWALEQMEVADPTADELFTACERCEVDALGRPHNHPDFDPALWL